MPSQARLSHSQPWLLSRHNQTQHIDQTNRSYKPEALFPFSKLPRPSIVHQPEPLSPLDVKTRTEPLPNRGDIPKQPEQNPIKPNISWPSKPPNQDELARDASLTSTDRFDLRQGPVSHPFQATSDMMNKLLRKMVKRSRAPIQVLRGEDDTNTRQARDRKIKSLRKKGLSTMKEEEEIRRLEQKRQERLPIQSKANNYRQHWKSVMEMERKQEVDAIKERRKSPIQSLIRSGIALDGLQAYWQDEKRRHFGKKVAVFKLFGAQELPRSVFRAGVKVTITSSDSVKRQNEIKGRSRAQSSQEVVPEVAEQDQDQDQFIEAEIVEKDKTFLRLKFEEQYENIDLVACESWRLDLGHNDVTFQRVQAALEAIDHDVEYIESRYSDNDKYMLSGTRLNDVILDIAPPADRVTHGAFWKNARIQSWYDRYSHTDAVAIEGDPILGLNPSQTRAVALMLKERVSLIQGPPGTGKTRTIVSAIKLLKLDFQVPHPILLAAHTNVAVDNLVEGCTNAGLKVVRTGPSSKARKSIENVTLDAHFLRHPLKPELDQFKPRMDKLEKIKTHLERRVYGKRASAADSADDIHMSEVNDIPQLSDKERLKSITSQLKQLKAQFISLRNNIRSQILKGADVICSSAIASGSPELDMVDLPIVFFDEGSMATEPVSLIPLMRGCRHLSIIGDHKQLPPVVTSEAAKEAGLSRSLFERLIENTSQNIQSTMLGVQFRMHPSLADFPNQTFYDGELINGESTANIKPLESSFLPTGEDSHLGFVHHVGKESKAEQHSLKNISEANLVFEILIDLLQRNPSLGGSEIGIITPYIGQQILFEQMLQNEMSKERMKANGMLGGDAARSAELGQVDIHTVDGFEGREKRVILFSTVRTNEEGYVGFLADGRRLNVALTRAQTCLLVVGNMDTFRNAQLTEAALKLVDSPNVQALKDFAQYVDDRDLVVNAAAMGFGDVKPGKGEKDMPVWAELLSDFHDSQ